MTISAFLILIAFLVVFACLYFGLSYFFSSSMENPDCSAKVTGNCGDTMELKVRLDHNRVQNITFWTDGCSISRSCIEAAARLARGKEIGELKKLNMVHIMEEVGQLPDTHLHCAQLAEITLHRVVEDYEKRKESKQTIKEAPVTQ